MDFLRLLVVSLLSMGMCKARVAYEPSMYMPYLPMEGPSKPYKLSGELSHDSVFPRSLYFPPQQEPGTGKPQVSMPMLPPFQAPQFPGKAPCSMWNPTGPCWPQTFPVEPKYPIGGPVHQVTPQNPVPKYPIGGQVPQVSLPMLPAEPKYPLLPPVELPQFPGKPPCSMWNPTGPCRPQTFPVEPKYPIGGPVHQVTPQNPGPKNPIGGPVPQVQQPMLPPFQFPGKAPCSVWSPAGPCRRQTFPVEPKYPIGGPVGYGLMPFLMFNLEGGTGPKDSLHHGQLAMNPNCQTKWPFLACN